MLDTESKLNEGIEDEDGEDVDLISQLEGMTLDKENAENENPEAQLKKKVLSLDNPVFKEDKESSKIQTVVSELKKLRKKYKWTKFRCSAKYCCRPKSNLFYFFEKRSKFRWYWAI